MRQQAARSDRPAARSGFTLDGTFPEGLYLPGSPEFLFWQCREAAIAAVEAWELSAGAHMQWQVGKRIKLQHNAGTDLNAYYDRVSFSFFQYVVGTKTVFSGASTDVVAHEVGHGLLDAIRPDLWDVNMTEAAAFHESFGDCMAILTALADKETRKALLANGTDLRRRNFVEGTAEDLAAAIRKKWPQHSASEPRHAYNKFKYQLPSALPNEGGPGALINEPHSFGMLFSGCFWELIAKLFEAGSSQTEAALAKAAQLAGGILIEGVKTAVIDPRFFQSVGRAMVLADGALNKGVNEKHIGAAFDAHGIMLGSRAMIAPTIGLTGPAPTGGSLSATTSSSLRSFLLTDKTSRFRYSAADLFGTKGVLASHTREIPLGGIDKDLRGVVCLAHEPVLVGASGSRAAIMGAIPQAQNTESEVTDFVKSLLDHNRIDLSLRRSTTTRSAVAVVDAPSTSVAEGFTHRVKEANGKKVLVRTCFRCGCIH
jgi:hypothetical protein